MNQPARIADTPQPPPIAGTIGTLATTHIANPRTDRARPGDVMLVLLYGSRQYSPADQQTFAVGDVIRLDQPASAPVQILRDGSEFAEGELIRDGHRWGVKITRLISGAKAKYAA